jgi:hypothetical protein
MPQSAATSKRPHRAIKSPRVKSRHKAESRYTVALAPDVVPQVEQYAATVDASMSKAIAALVRLGLENQETRKREFFKRLKQNLADDDPKQQDRLVNEFRSLILGL